MSVDCALRILGYIVGSLQVNIPDETFPCRIRDTGSQSETTSSLSFTGCLDDDGRSSVKHVVEASAMTAPSPEGKLRRVPI